MYPLANDIGTNSFINIPITINVLKNMLISNQVLLRFKQTDKGFLQVAVGQSLS